MHRQQILGSGIILGTILVLSFCRRWCQHRASAQGSGIGLLWTDVALLVVYGLAGMICIREDACDRLVLLRTNGCRVPGGLLLGSYIPRPDANLHCGVFGEYDLVPSCEEV